MMHVYTRPETTLELVRRYLCANPTGTWIETSVRELARIVGRSAGQMSRHIEQLVRDGWIDAASDHRSTLIEVLRSDLGGDSAHDRQETRSCASDAPERDHVAARESDDLVHDRSGVVRKSQNLDQQQQCVGDSSFSFSGDQALYQRLVANPDMNPQLAQRIAQNPPGTLAEFDLDLAAATRHPSVNTPFWCVVSCWRDGQRFNTREEVSHAAPAQSSTGGTPATQRDSAGRGRRSGYQSNTERRAAIVERLVAAVPDAYKLTREQARALPRIEIPAALRDLCGHGYGRYNAGGGLGAASGGD